MDKTATEGSRRRAGISIFRYDDAPTLAEAGSMSPPVFPDSTDPALFPQLMAAGLEAGNVVRVLFSQDGPGGFSLAYAWFKPGYVLARHSHDVDCVYYVVSGEATLGSQVVRAGDGFFAPADAPYGYTAGPDGVEILEFRHATSFDMQVGPMSPGQWQTLLDAARSNHDLWSSLREPAPSRAHLAGTR